MHFTRSILFFLISLSPAAVQAQGYTQNYTQCLNNAYGKTATIDTCVDKEFKIQKKSLNQYYKNYLKNTPVHTSSIEKQHQLWENRVNQQCYFETTSSLVKIKQKKCVLEMTMQRAYYYELKQVVYK